MPRGKWDAFNESASRLGDDMDFREVVIYGWESVWDPETGDTDDTLVEQQRVDGEVREPTMPRMATGPEGGESEVDVEIYVEADDVGDLVETGEEQRASVIEDTLSGTRYRADEIFPEGNGLLRISGVEL